MNIRETRGKEGKFGESRGNEAIPVGFPRRVSCAQGAIRYPFRNQARQLGDQMPFQALESRPSPDFPRSLAVRFRGR
jgi:hypothetical protein